LSADRFTFPGRMAEWFSKRRSSLTVAGPRRIRTGLPCYAHRGHPNKRTGYITTVSPLTNFSGSVARRDRRESSIVITPDPHSKCDAGIRRYLAVGCSEHPSTSC